MIKIYENGNDLISENKAFLESDKYLACFFFWDAPLLERTDKRNYAVKVTSGSEELLALKVEPYNMLLFGSSGAVCELFEYLLTNGYEADGILGSETVCDRAVGFIKERFGVEYYEALAMDFMEAKTKTEPSSDEIEVPTEKDLPEIIDCLNNFVIDCGLLDKVSEENARKTLSQFRVIRKNGVIVSMAKVVSSSDDDMKITNVYTRPEHRGKGYARKVVNAAKNEILEMGKTATLNVDKKNPISNRIYASLGFSKVFSQGEYRRK